MVVCSWSPGEPKRARGYIWESWAETVPARKAGLCEESHAIR
jgi:hypothetical protein